MASGGLGARSRSRVSGRRIRWRVRSARSPAASLPYRQHPRQQLPDAQAHRPLQDPPLASCGVELFTPEEKESKSKGENDELEARHLRQVCNFRWPHVCNIGRPLTGPTVTECPGPERLLARVMSFGVRPAFLQILGNAGERSGDSVALVLKASASSRNRAGRPVLNGFRAYTVAERRAVHFAPGAPPTLPGGVAPGVSVLAGGRSSRRESRSIMLRPSL